MSAGGGPWAADTAAVEGAAYSEVSVLTSPALSTLFGLLPRLAGDAAPAVDVETGLSPTRLLIKSSIERRSSRPGVGDTI